MGKRGRSRRPNTTTPLTGVTWTTLGLVTGAENAAANWATLVAAPAPAAIAAAGYIIQVDGDYYLNAGATPFDVTNLILVGTNPALHKLHLDTGSYFNVTGTTPSNKGVVLVKGITLDGIGTGTTKFVIQTAPFVNNITFDSCELTGNVRAVFSVTGESYDFDTNVCYTESVNITNNYVHDIYDVDAGVIFGFYNTPVYQATIENNKVKNFCYAFCAINANNDHPFNLYIIGNCNADIRNNTIYCEDSYNPATASGDADAPTGYYVFCQIEGYVVDCRENVFDGMHAFAADNTNLYDNYLSCVYLTYEYNTIRNCVNFSTVITERDLMKGKTAQPVGTLKKTRIYRYNAYVVEASYADRFGQDRLLLRKRMINNTTVMDNIDISYNTFDVYILTFLQGGVKVNETCKFNNNTLTADTAETITDTQAFSYVYVKRDGEGAPIASSLEFKDNTLICDSIPSGAAAGAYHIHFLNVYQVSGGSLADDLTTVTMTGNTIQGYFTDYTNEAAEIAKYTTYGGDVTPTISGNTITPLS